MDKQRQTIKLIVSGRYSRTSHLQNQEEGNLVDKELSTLQKQKQEEQRQINKIIKQKYNTFIKWDFRQSLPKHLRKLSQTQKNKVQAVTQNSTAMNFSLIMQSTKQKNKRKTKIIQPNIDKKQSKAKPSPDKTIKFAQIEKQNKKQNKQQQKIASQMGLTPQMQAIKIQKRQRFKKIHNPMQFLKHYIQKQQYTPTQEQKHLIEKLLNIQKSLQSQMYSLTQDKQPNLEGILQNAYQLMNLAVDYNQLLFLSLLVCLVADICYFLKDYSRSFYFYNQSRTAGSYANLDKLKIPSLMGMGRICFDMQYLQEAKRIFRKALQYAWRNNDENTQLQVYDWFGQIYNQRGKVKQSLYYHQKFAKNNIQPPKSALRKISRQMLEQHDKHIDSLQHSNLDSLFLQYLHLPINKKYEVKKKSSTNKTFKNYDLNGQSPRFNKDQNDFSRKSFPDVKFQLYDLLNNDYEFKTEIPDPDKPGSRQLNRLFNKSGYDCFDGKKRQLLFEHSVQYNKIMRKKPQKPNIQKQLKKPLDQRVQLMLKQRLKPDWYQSMVSEIKKKRMQKVGALKQKVRNSHLSYGKYPSQRRRQAIWSTQKINQSFNKFLLDWIDPI